MQVLVDLTEKGAAEVVFHPNKHRRGQCRANPRTLLARGQAGHYASKLLGRYEDHNETHATGGEGADIHVRGARR